MSRRAVVLACFLLILVIPAEAQWMQTNSPKNDILTFGGDVSCLASIGNKLFAGENGLLLSTDSGTNWTQVSGGLNGLGVGTLLVNGDKIFAGTTGGLFRSTDSGTTWNILPVDTSIISITSFAVNGSNIIAASRSGFSSRIYLSTNNGVSWNPVDANTPFAILSLADMNGNFYAGTIGEGVFLSTDNGASWTWTGGGPMSVNGFAISDGNLLAATDNGMFISNGDSGNWTSIDSGLLGSRIYAITLIGQNLYAGTWGSGIFLSTNNGTSWNALGNSGLTNLYVNAISINNGIIYDGTDGDGVFLSTDNGSHWTVHNPLTSIISSINSLDTISGNFFACTQAGLFVTTDSGNVWTLDSNGIGNVGASTVLGFGDSIFVGTSSGIFISANNSSGWTPNGLSGENISELTQYDGIFYAVDQGVFVSTDNGVTWKRPTNDGAPSTNAFVAIGSNLIAGSNVNPLYYSSDTGKDWYSVQDVPTSCNVNALAVIGNIVYAGTNSDGVWLSTDNGMDWAEANDSGLTDLNVTTLLVNGATLFAVTSGEHIFFSSDNGAIWHPVDSGLQMDLQITSLAVKDSILYAGTLDSGIWRHSLAKAVPAPSGIVVAETQASTGISIYPNPATSHIQITASDGNISILDPLGRSYEVRQAGNMLNISALPSGVYFVSDGVTRAKFVKE